MDAPLRSRTFAERDRPKQTFAIRTTRFPAAGGERRSRTGGIGP